MIYVHSSPEPHKQDTPVTKLVPSSAVHGNKVTTVLEGDTDFLPLLGRGTDAANLREWRQQVDTHCGPVMRQVKEDYSNVMRYTQGEESSSVEKGSTKSMSYGGSASVKGGGAPTGVPFSVSLGGGGSRSHTNYLSSSESVTVVRTYTFKEETPSFPTELEKDLSKFVFEWQKSQPLTSAMKMGEQESLEEYLLQLEKDRSDKSVSSCIQEVENAIKTYIAEKRITYYISSIALGKKDTETKERTQKGTKVKIGAGANVPGHGGGSISAGGKSEQDSTISREMKLGGDNLAIVKVGLTVISDLVQSSHVKAIIERAIPEYEQEKQKKVNKERELTYE